jgi:hypothetical protein
MAISPWTKPLEMKIAPLPFEALAYGYEKRQQRQDKADELLSGLDESFLKINSIPLDTPRKQELVGELQQQVYSLVDKYKGDLAGALPEIKALNRKVQYETNYGELGAIKERYNQFSTAEAKRAEAVKRYMMGEKGGMSEEDALNARNYELSRMNKPIEKTAYGWSTYNTMASQPHVDIETKVMEVAKEMKPQTVEQMTGLKYDSNTGYFVNLTTGDTSLAADEIERAAYRMVMQDREVNDYLKFKHTVSGDLDNWRQTLANSPAEGVIIDTPQGQVQMNADQWLEESFYGDVKRAARNAGNIYRQSKRTINADYKENWRARDNEREARERALYDFQLPAQTLPAVAASAPESVGVSPDGSIQGGQENAAGTGLRRWGYLLSPVRDMIGVGIAAIFDPTLATTGVPSSNSGRAATQRLNQSVEDMGKIFSTETKQQAFDKQAEELRKEFPEVATKFPKTQKTKQTGDGSVTYDANAGNVINFVQQSIKNGSAVIGNMMTPRQPAMSESVQKALFNTNVFNRVTYSLQEGGTKRQAEEKLGFEDGVPQEALDKAVFTGFGGFLNPGAVLAQIPDKNGVPQDIVMEQDAATKRVYTHSIRASQAFKNNKAQQQVVYEADNGVNKPFLYEYSPNISADGVYGVKINRYSVTPDNKKGTLLNSSDAKSVYEQEYVNWLTQNNFTLD